MINYKIKNKDINLILCIIGGWFGLHHFYNKKIGLGLLYFCTGGLFCIGWIIDIIKIATLKEITSNGSNVKNNKKKNAIDEDNNQKFKCEIIKNDNKSEFKDFIDTLIYFEELDRKSLYDGYSNKEIKESGFKVYMCENISLPCEIIGNNDNFHYELKYTDHNNNYYFGYIPEEYNQIITEIINDREIIYGGMIFEYGYYKEYDFIEDKITNGYDEIKIFVNILYK